MAYRFPRIGILAGRDNRSGTSGGDCLVAFAGVVVAISRHGTDHFVRRDLVQQLRQNRRVTDIAAGGFDSPHLQRFRVDPDMYLAPDAPFGSAMLAGVPLTLAFGLDAGAVRPLSGIA